MLDVSGCEKEREATAPAAPPEVEFVTVEQKDVPIHQEWVGTLEGDINATASQSRSMLPRQTAILEL